MELTCPSILEATRQRAQFGFGTDHAVPSVPLPPSRRDPSATTAATGGAAGARASPASIYGYEDPMASTHPAQPAPSASLTSASAAAQAGGPGANSGPAYERKKQRAKDARVRLNDAIERLSVVIGAAGAQSRRRADRMRAWCEAEAKAAATPGPGAGTRGIRTSLHGPSSSTSLTSATPSPSIPPVGSRAPQAQRPQPPRAAAGHPQAQARTQKGALPSSSPDPPMSDLRCLTIHSIDNVSRFADRAKKWDRPSFVGTAADVVDGLNAQCEALLRELADTAAEAEGLRRRLEDTEMENASRAGAGLGAEARTGTGTGTGIGTGAKETVRTEQVPTLAQSLNVAAPPPIPPCARSALLSPALHPPSVTPFKRPVGVAIQLSGATNGGAVCTPSVVKRPRILSPEATLSPPPLPPAAVRASTGTTTASESGYGPGRVLQNGRHPVAFAISTNSPQTDPVAALLLCGPLTSSHSSSIGCGNGDRDDELVRRVASYLDPTSLLRCSMVCRLWRGIRSAAAVYELAVVGASGPFLDEGVWTALCVRRFGTANVCSFREGEGAEGDGEGDDDDEKDDAIVRVGVEAGAGYQGQVKTTLVCLPCTTACMSLIYGRPLASWTAAPSSVVSPSVASPSPPGPP